MEDERIKPRVLKGFKDHSPLEARQIQHIFSVFKSAFEMFGFCPLETTVIEPQEILLSNLGEDPNKQIYRFEDLEKNQVGLRYDLTVSLARYVAMNLNSLAFPFKRYQFGKVWRFDKPKRGRLREFFQLDADILGAPPIEPEVELLRVFCTAFESLGMEDFYFRVNDRRYLAEGLRRLNVSEERAKDVFRVLDKLESQGEAKVFKELTGQLLLQDFDSVLEYERMQEVKLEHETAKALLKWIGNREEVACYFEPFIRRLEMEGISESRVRPDASLTRGLDYYTGFVCEMVLPGAEQVGSVGGGGRYDNLVAMYSKREVTGVGISLGVDRLLESLKLKHGKDYSVCGEDSAQSTAKVFVAVFDDSLVSESSRIARILRQGGIPTEMWLYTANNKGSTLSRQFKFADKVGIPLVVVPGEEELRKNPPTVQLKDLRTGYGEEGKQVEVVIETLVTKIRDILGCAEG